MNKLIVFILCIALFSCKKEIDFSSDQGGPLNFSNDTITFDTIFASIGSITKTLTVYNYNDYDVTTNIRLSGNSSANFRMNIDGIAGNNQEDINIPANDSIFIFLEVTIDPSNNTTPYILSDSIIFSSDNNSQTVKLVAWGQDAYFHTPNTFGEIINGTDTTKFYYHLLDCSVPWENDKPHVIYGYAIVDPGNTLTINEGCQVYLHKNSGLIIGNPFKEEKGGTLIINGQLGNEVTFQGDRLDSWYKDSPGQWDRIWITPGSIDNNINYAIIKNGNIGIHADTVYNNNPTLNISNTVISNMTGVGILGQGAKINGHNLVISKCGQYTVACNIGGQYSFSHCTFANYWDYGRRSTPSILLNNYYEGIDGQTYVRDLEEASFTNCIIDGGLSTEVSFMKNDNGNFNYMFQNCLIKLDNSDVNSTNYSDIILNKNPEFVNVSNNDFNLTESSSAINSGILTSFTNDISGNFRSEPDIGAYEYID